MKFLFLGSGCTHRNLRREDFDRSDVGGVSGHVQISRTAGSLLISSHLPKAMSARFPHLVWDGAPIDRDIAFSPLLPVPDAARRVFRYLDALGEGTVADHLSGVFCVAAMSADGDFLAAPDGLSQYALFTARIAGCHLIGNCLHLIEKTARLLGHPVTRDMTAAAYEIAFGAGGWTRTGFAEVKKLPPNHFARYSNGSLEFVSFPTSIVARQRSEGRYKKHLPAVVDRLIESASAMAMALPDQGLVLDLSGGKDTRLVLASMMASGTKKFHVFLGGAEDGPDQQVASKLVRHFDLDSVEFLSNLLEEEHLSAKEVARRAAYRFAGTSSLHQAELGLARINYGAQVRGGASEARTRSFYSLPDKRRRRHSLFKYRAQTGPKMQFLARLRLASASSFGTIRQEELLQMLLLARGKRNHHLFTESFLEQAFVAFGQQLQWLQKLGVADVNLADCYYLFDRGWRHCGFPVQVMNDWKPVFEPLNDIRLLEAQFSLGSLDRRNARVVHDLFKRFGVEDMMALPFEGDRWPGEMLTAEEQRLRAQLEQISSERIAPRSIFGAAGMADSKYTMGVEPYMETLGDYFLELASSLPAHHTCWYILKRDHVLTLARQRAFSQAPLAQAGVQLLQALVWLSGDESRVVPEH